VSKHVKEISITNFYLFKINKYLLSFTLCVLAEIINVFAISVEFMQLKHSYNRADLQCKKFGLCCSYLTFLFHCFNRFKTEFLGCYECFISVFCLWHIIALEFSPVLPTELFLCHLFRSSMRMLYTHCFSDLILQAKLTYKLKWNEFVNKEIKGLENWRRFQCVSSNRRRERERERVCRCQNQ
jgi:hypothetical protein